MTNLQAIEKIRPLPKLKDGYEYYVSKYSRVTIYNKNDDDDYRITLFNEFGDIIENKYHKSMEEYIRCFKAKPIYRKKCEKILVGWK